MTQTQKRVLAALMICLLACPLFGAAAPSESPVPFQELKFGSRGDGVSALQARLADLGYYLHRIDGIFGSHTRQAVNRFQMSENLGVNGVANFSTQEALFTPETKPVRVYLSPQGKRYHARNNCRGLALAQQIDELPFPEAEAIRTPCIICYGRLPLRIAEEKKASQKNLPTETETP